MADITRIRCDFNGPYEQADVLKVARPKTDAQPGDPDFNWLYGEWVLLYDNEGNYCLGQVVRDGGRPVIHVELDHSTMENPDRSAEAWVKLNPQQAVRALVHVGALPRGTESAVPDAEDVEAIVERVTGPQLDA